MATPLMHIHIPKLFEYANEAAIPIVLASGQGSLIYALYLHCIMYHAKSKHNSHEDPLNNMTLYRISRSGHMRPEHVYNHTLSADMCMRLLDHVADVQSSLVTSMMALLVQHNGTEAETDSIISCIQRLSIRCTTQSRLLLFNNALRRCGNRRVADCLMSYGAHVKPSSITDVENAICRGDMNLARQLVQSEPVLVANCACYGGHLDILQMVVNTNPAFRITNSNLRTALCLDHLHLCDYMYTTGVSDLDKNTLWSAVSSVEAARWLLNHDLITDDLVTCLCCNDRLDVLHLVIGTLGMTVPADILPRCVISREPAPAIRYPDLFMIDYLLSHGADVNAQDASGNTMLYYLPLYSRYLLDKGAKTAVS